MGKIRTQIKKHYKTNIITLIVAAVVALTIFLLYFFIQSPGLISAVNGTGVGAIVLTVVGLLMWFAHEGFFDIFSFGIKQLVSVVFSRNPIRDGNYSDYKNSKTEKRDNSSYNFLMFILVGVVLGVSCLILYIFYRSEVG